MSSKKVFAVIPGYNVEKTVGNVVRETKKYVDEVIYVDDGSFDNSAKVAKKEGVLVIKYKPNMGKGFALRTGFKTAIRLGADVIITLDSDGQHYPKYIPKFLKILDMGYDVVVGSRYAGRFYTFPRNVIGNFGLNFITNFLSYGPQNLFRHKWLGDTQSGYRAFRVEALKKMNLTSNRYEIEGELTFEIAKNNLKVKEIPIITKAKIKGVTIMDGINNAKFLFKKRFRL
ncbi:MAG: glycosyltransferase family 2 protein [Candidatus Aenigmarchaeota archaeon]|nr:glycosyltransferase family 2 protein [Candidatus Aenigmarchaeota archaeon]